MVTRKDKVSKDERVTIIILINISLVITVWLLFSFLINPQHFISHYLGIQPGVFNDPIAWILTFIIAFSYTIYTIVIIPFVREKLFTISWLKLAGIWVALSSSTVEEVFFRKRLMDWLNDLEFSAVSQLLISAAIFGLAHSAWGLLRGEIKIILPVVLSTAILGGALAVLYLVADRNILAPIIAHILINLFIEPWLMLAAVSGNMSKAHDR